MPRPNRQSSCHCLSFFLFFREAAVSLFLSFALTGTSLFHNLKQIGLKVGEYRVRWLHDWLKHWKRATSECEWNYGKILAFLSASTSFSLSFFLLLFFSLLFFLLLRSFSLWLLSLSPLLFLFASLFFSPSFFLFSLLLYYFNSSPKSIISWQKKEWESEVESKTFRCEKKKFPF